MNRHPTMITTTARRLAVSCSLALLGAASPLSAQQTSSSSGDAEFRWAKAIPNGSLVRLANVSGDVSVIGADVERVELVARRRGSSSDSEARVEVKEHADGITICALREEDSYCDERGMHEDGSRWGGRRSRARYDLEVRVPRGMRVSASTVSGGVQVSGTTREMRVSSVSGDVRLDRVDAVDRFRVSTVSGDVVASLASVARGTDLQVKSVSGDIDLSMPPSTALDLNMSTVSGRLNSDFALQVRGRLNRRRIDAQINDGGSDLRVSTVSGDVRLAHN